MDHQYVVFLQEAMLAALGCTEPIALAYAAATGRKYLPADPSKILVRCSGNMIKNAKSVIVPHSGGLKGIAISSILGAIAGNPEKKLEVLTDVQEADIERAKSLEAERICTVEHAKGYTGLYIDTTMEAVGPNGKTHRSRVVIQNHHTSIVRIEQDETLVLDSPAEECVDVECDFSFVKIYEFASNGDITPLLPILHREIEYNEAIAKEGLTNPWGAQIGRSLYERAKKAGDQIGMEIAHAAAGSDARMSGCEMPVVINSGSGNQGMTVSLPIIERARKNGASQEELDRALIFANLIASYIKAHIGCLSAFCGAVSAASAALGGIAFLEKQPKEVVSETISNSLVTTGGMLCDGAKPSCAAKIATALHTAYAAYDQAKEGRSFVYGDGLVGKDLDHTIAAIGQVAREGMQSTDEQILQQMIQQ